jgi:hypothetical protein
MHRLKEAGLHSMSEDPAAAVDTSTPAAKTLWPTSSNSRCAHCAAFASPFSMNLGFSVVCCPF